MRTQFHWWVRRKHTEPDEAYTTPIDLPEFLIEFSSGKPAHILIFPRWIASDGITYIQEAGEKIFSYMKSHYDELEGWRLCPQHEHYITTTYPLGLVVSKPNWLKSVIGQVVATQIVITSMIDDYQFHNNMNNCIRPK